MEDGFPHLTVSFSPGSSIESTRMVQSMLDSVDEDGILAEGTDRDSGRSARKWCSMERQSVPSSLRK